MIDEGIDIEMGKKKSPKVKRGQIKPHQRRKRTGLNTMMIE